ncbi:MULTISPECIES: hypothetical protein [unclassified Paenibacillus]|uniref:hypothetical protein n=1 Tax=unclassified Paenibacillus TaxID=185978 RepID=UPI0009C6A3A9|nr:MULTISPECIES: hypothetical protein [unclassified Paenibacillus]SLK22890.1 hypothetical protein SAMN06272722_12621 [Paenibacillus sp. RU5A]SOC77520.1 hypothetical protein SAMN05880581_12621 [Paenibacillus sp. RU26A]SOC78464.1 hypothetical protein SAMN05880586_12621 [Paenibacillus sp. RU5M]
MIGEQSKIKFRPNKIHIIGSVGSGKSTLARLLSARLDLPYYELDNIVWHRVPKGQDIRNSPEKRDTLLQKAVYSNQWIIEGVHYEWVERSFEQADLIVYLNTPCGKGMCAFSNVSQYRSSGWNKEITDRLSLCSGRCINGAINMTIRKRR